MIDPRRENGVRVAEWLIYRKSAWNAISECKFAREAKSE
jgi:hypothetical protein